MKDLLNASLNLLTILLKSLIAASHFVRIIFLKPMAVFFAVKH